MNQGDRGEWDFFVSYTQADREWAEWIAWQLEAAGHPVLVQAWDFVPGSNWVRAMHEGTTRAARTVAVLSPDYLGSVYAGAEWQAAWALDPTGEQGRVLPVRVADCERPPLLAGVVGVDLFGMGEAAARAELLRTVAALGAGRAKPVAAPRFPGGTPAFPGRGWCGLPGRASRAACRRSGPCRSGTGSSPGAAPTCGGCASGWPRPAP